MRNIPSTRMKPGLVQGVLLIEGFELHNPLEKTKAAQTCADKII